MKRLTKGIALALTGLALAGQTAAADVDVRKSSQVRSERYVPGVWVDPDGCEHWVMDDGVEGYMTPHVTRQGIPVCNRGNPCMIMNSDQLFAVDSSSISRHGRARLQEFFRTASARTFIIEGHTDSTASDAYNMRLSERRARAVAAVASGVGKPAQVRWYGERDPRATNRTHAGRQKNRRVEIICVR